MFSSQISSERPGAQQATEVLGQEFLDQISPEGDMFMFYLFRLEPSVEFLFILLSIGMTPTYKNFTVATAFMRNEQRHIDQNVLAKLTEMIKDEECGILLEDIAAFWRTLEIGVDIPSAQAQYMDSKIRDLASLLDQISIGPISKVREVRRIIKGVLSPALPEDPSATLTTTSEHAATKGRQKTNFRHHS
ncbi:hypothetical protein M9H77_22608 [Catharanthus roseus]|uniref:Uncharacterized protein n=1 Tax=Catharanthus roseus TaxID=4058 RepID=A0ACC0ASG7_CATRO|nr:hypothetical protein M9H77_22608 [Catharanthus roseus]